MMEKFIGELANFITANRYVNLYSMGFNIKKKEGRQTLEHLRSRLSGEYGPSFIDIDARIFRECETEEQEAVVILKPINKALKENGDKETKTIRYAISIADALEKLSKRLKQPVLLVFHCFYDFNDEREKDILRAIRKFIEIYERSQYLGILILSERQTFHWELYPESKLDERHLAYKEYPLEPGLK